MTNVQLQPEAFILGLAARKKIHGNLFLYMTTMKKLLYVQKWKSSTIEEWLMR